MPMNEVNLPVFVYNDSHFIFETSIHVNWLTKHSKGSLMRTKWPK